MVSFTFCVSPEVPFCHFITASITSLGCVVFSGTLTGVSQLVKKSVAIIDRFFQGNQMFGFYTDDKLKAGNQLGIYLQGISERYNNYMEKLLNIAATNGGNPFATPPANLRGNIINQTNEANFPLGYFSLGEIDTGVYIVQ